MPTHIPELGNVRLDEFDWTGEKKWTNISLAAHQVVWWPVFCPKASNQSLLPVCHSLSYRGTLLETMWNKISWVNKKTKRRNKGYLLTLTGNIFLSIVCWLFVVTVIENKPISSWCVGGIEVRISVHLMTTGRCWWLQEGPSSIEGQLDDVRAFLFGVFWPFRGESKDAQSGQVFHAYLRWGDCTRQIWLIWNWKKYRVVS